MEVTVIVATFGDQEWVELAHRRAVPSAPEPVIHQHHDTLAAARNHGAEMAATEWLCFLDADDELAPGYMEAMAEAEADLRGPAVVYVRDGVREEPKLWPAKSLRHGNYLPIGTLVRRDMFFKAGGFRDEPLYEDWSLWLRCWNLGASVQQVRDAHYIAHVRTGSRNLPPKAVRRHWFNEIRNAA